MDSCWVRAFNKQELNSSLVGSWLLRDRAVMFYSQWGAKILKNDQVAGRRTVAEECCILYVTTYETTVAALLC